MKRAVLTGTGLWTPSEGITNAELVESLSQAVGAWNAERAEAIESGEIEERDTPMTAAKAQKINCAVPVDNL